MTTTYKVQVTTDDRPDEWRGNFFCFATEREAYHYLSTQTGRGSNIRHARVIQADEPVNARMHGGLTARLEVL